jgi:hypothetical protein
VLGPYSAENRNEEFDTMVSDRATAFFVYPVRSLLYIAHSIVLTSTLAVGLLLISSLSIGIAWFFDAVGVSILYVVPILGMATYLAQFNIESWNEAPSDPEYEDLFEKIAADAFVVLYYNFLFLLSVVLGVVLVPLLTSSGIGVSLVDSYLIVGFSYPIIDIILFEKWNMSPAALPVALFVALLHKAGKVTWLNARTLNIGQVPIIDLFIEEKAPPIH